MKRLMDRVQEQHANKKLIVQTPSDGTKMSAVLESFAEPYDNIYDPLEMRRKILKFAMLAWNAAIMEDWKGVNIWEEHLSILPTAERPIAREIITSLMNRKRLLFRDFNRLIVDFELIENGDEAYLSVVSSHPLSKITPISPQKIR